VDDHRPYPCRDLEGRGYAPSRAGGGECPTTDHPSEETEPEEVNAYRRQADQDALRAYHLDRVTGKFKMVISAENAELLAGLLGSDGEEQQGAA
jgi:hypothetical protein